MKGKGTDFSPLSPFFIAHFLPQRYSESARIKGEKILSYARKPQLLDAGCGCGWLSRMALARGFQVTPIDISLQVIELEKIFAQAAQEPALKIRQASVTKLPFKNESFETVLCSEVLEHLPANQIDEALAEFERVLKPQGRLVLTVPGFLYGLFYDRLLRKFTCGGEENAYWNFFQKHLPKEARRQLKLKYEPEYAHQKNFSPLEIKKRLRKAGFSLVAQKNLEVYAPFLRSLSNFLGFTRDKVKRLERLDGFLADFLPLFFGLDWLFVAEKRVDNE